MFAPPGLLPADKLAPPSISLVPTEPIELRGIAIQATSHAAYEALFAISRDGDLSTQLCDRLVGDGDEVELRGRLRVRVITCSPASQGVITRATHLTLLRLDAGRSDPPVPTIPNGSDWTATQDGDDGADEDVEIAEAFLSSRMAHFERPCVRDQDAARRLPGDDGSMHIDTVASPAGWRREDAVDDERDPEATIFVQMACMARMGLMGGAHVVVRVGTAARLAQVFPIDRVPLPAGVVAHACAAPALLARLTVDAADHTSPVMRVALHATDGETGTQPVATAVTVARISSPLAVDRQYQALCLLALKRHFADRRRALLPGDCFAVPINADLATHGCAGSLTGEEQDVELE